MWIVFDYMRDEIVRLCASRDEALEFQAQYEGYTLAIGAEHFQ